MTHHSFTDAASTDGLVFEVATQRRACLGLFDRAPPLSETARAGHIKARARWPHGARGRQVAFDQRGKVQILRLEDKTEIAVWWTETRASVDN
jgi:hypothetical protein